MAVEAFSQTISPGSDTLSFPETEQTQRYALISVSDKTGVVGLAKIIDRAGYRIISTGGTAKALTDDGLPVIPIQEITGTPESFEGRMKTISFRIEGGILFDRTKTSQVKEAEKLGVPQIDLVVANLYPFEKTVADPNTTYDEATEQIDVGGPTMVRSAAKNHKSVVIIVDPKDYDRVGEAIKAGEIDPQLKRELAAKAFGHLSLYDSQIRQFLETGEDFAEELTLPGRKTTDLKYGENPHLAAALYLEPNTNSPMRKLKRIGGGRESSATNITDINAGIESVRIFRDTPVVVVIKLNTPSGIALGETVEEALKRAVEADPISAYGGVVVSNKPLDMDCVRILEKFREQRGQMDIISAPFIPPEVLEKLIDIRKNVGIYTFGEIPRERSQRFQVKPIDGGFVLQEWDDDETNIADWKIATRSAPTRKQLELMRFGWDAARRMKSNTIVAVDKDIPMTRGIGTGQTSRIASVEIALAQAGGNAIGSILISDSFFPFGDSVKLARDAGVGAILQQGGSKRDNDSIEVANEAGIPMVFTGRRAFWH